MVVPLTFSVVKTKDEVVLIRERISMEEIEDIDLSKSNEFVEVLSRISRFKDGVLVNHFGDEERFAALTFVFKVKNVHAHKDRRQFNQYELTPHSPIKTGTFKYIVRPDSDEEIRKAMLLIMETRHTFSPEVIDAIEVAQAMDYHPSTVFEGVTSMYDRPVSPSSSQQLLEILDLDGEFYKSMDVLELQPHLNLEKTIKSIQAEALRDEATMVNVTSVVDCYHSFVRQQLSEIKVANDTLLDTLCENDETSIAELRSQAQIFLIESENRIRRFKRRMDDRLLDDEEEGSNKKQMTDEDFVVID